MIHQGTATVESQGVLIAECGPGEFLGEARAWDESESEHGPADGSQCRSRMMPCVDMQIWASTFRARANQ